MSGTLLGVSVLELRTDQRQLDSGLAQANVKADQAGASMQKTMDKRMVSMGSSMQKVGSSLTRNVTVPLALIGIAAGKMGSDFDAAMEKIHTQAGATQKEVNDLRGQVLDLAKVSAFGPTDLANALFRLEGAGLRGARAMKALADSAKLAAVGDAGVEDTAKAVAEVFASGIKGGGNFNQVVAQLNATVGAGDLRLQNLVDALGVNLLPAAANVGLKLSDVTAALAVFGDQTNNVSGFASQLATALHFLTNPSKEADGALHSMGLTATKLITDLQQPQGLLVALTALKSGLDKLPGGPQGPKAIEALGEILPGGRGRVIEDLITNLDRLGSKYTTIGHTSDQFAGDVAKTQQTAAYKIHQAWSDTQVALDMIGHDILPEATSVLGSIANDAEKVATAFSHLPKGAQDMLITGGLIAAGIGPAMKVLGLFTSGIGRLYQIAKLTSGLASGRTNLGSLLSGRGMAGTGSGVGALGGLTGVKGAGIGSALNPLVMTLESGSAANLGSRAAAIGEAEEGGGAATSAGGVILPPGVRSTTETAALPAGEEEVVGATLLSRVGSVVSKGIGAGLIGVGGLLASKLIGSSIGGSTGRAVTTVGEGATAGAVLGSVLPGVGTLAGAVVGGGAAAIGEGVRALTGTQSASDVLKKLSGEVQTAASAGNLAKLHTLAAEAKDMGDKLREGGESGSQGFLDLAKTIEKNAPEIQRQMDTTGKQAGKVFVADFQAIKFPSAWAFQANLDAQLKKLPADARPAAAEVALKLAEGLEQNGKLPKGAVDNIIASIKGEFPGLQAYLQRAGMDSDAELASGLQFKTSTANLQKFVATAKLQFGLVGVQSKLTGANIDSNLANAMGELEQIAANGTKATRAAAMKEIDLLKSQSADAFSSMLADVTTKQGKLTQAIQNGSAKAAQVGAQNMDAFGSSVYGAMSAGVLSTTKGAQLIAQALNATLTAFGSKPIPLTSVLGAATLASVLAGTGAATGATTGASSAGSGAAAGISSGAAGGALLQVGRAGDRGRDTVPMSVGGTGIVVGRGEQVAVFNADQQRDLNSELAHRGGLPGFFAGRAWRKHYMAAGGLVPGSERINTPTVQGGGTVATVVADALRKATAAANSRIAKIAPPAATGRGGRVPSGPFPAGGGFTPSQLGMFDGLQVADWIIPELAWARAHGWQGVVTSGWRSPTQVVHGVFATAPQGESEHQYDIYPGGAVDVSDYEQFAQVIGGYRGQDKLIQLGIDPLHFSGTGHALGGIVVKGPVSTFGPPGEAASSTAYGRSSGDAGLSLRLPGTDYDDPRNRALMGHVFDVLIAGHHGRFTDIDLGPNQWTGRDIDVTGKAVEQMGFAYSAFPTNAIGTATEVTASTASKGVTAKTPKPRKPSGPAAKLIAAISGALAKKEPLISRGIGSLNSLLADAGSGGKLADLIDYTGQNDDGWVAGYVDAHPGLDPSTGVVTPVDGSAPSVDAAFVSRRADQLVTMLSWQATIKAELGQAEKLIAPLVKRIKAAILQRQQQITRARAMIRSNLTQIHRLTLQLNTENQRKPKDTQRVGSLTSQIKGLQNVNLTLGGQSGRVGTTGQIGSLTSEIGSLKTRLSTVNSDQTSLVGPSGIGGWLGDAKVALLPSGDLPSQIFALSPGSITAALTAAQGGASSTDTSALADLLEQQNSTLADDLAVSQAQYGALSSLGSLPPFGGSFATGGIVPGPLGAARTVIAHGGEPILPAGSLAGTLVENHTHISPKGNLNDLIDVRVEQRTRKMARIAGMGLPSRGGGRLG